MSAPVPLAMERSISKTRNTRHRFLGLLPNSAFGDVRVPVESILGDNVGLYYLESFMATEFSDDLIHFWRSCEKYRRLCSRNSSAEHKGGRRVGIGAMLRPVSSESSIHHRSLSHESKYKDRTSTRFKPTKAIQRYARKIFVSLLSVQCLCDVQ